MSGSILILGAVAILVLFIGFGFLLGLLRGFRKSLFFTIVFIAVVIISFIVATALAKGFYSGGTLWGICKKIIPEKMREGSEGVTSLKEFIRFYITHNFTEMLDSGKTAGESIVENANAMGIIDGLIVMILKIVMLIVSYIFLTVIFYILFGLIYILFLRQKTIIETETVTDEDGNETVTEREIKPNKRRLLGGIIGGAKGLVKALIILLPISFAIGMMAQIEIPTNSQASSEEIYLEGSSSSSNKTLKDIVSACKQYDNSIGKMYLGLDNFVMDRVISYDVKGADGKKRKVVLRSELEGFIDVYNTIEKEIGVDNLKNYDFKANINSKEMKAVVKSLTTTLSDSKALTTLLTAVGDEATVIASDKLDDKDPDLALLFEEIKLSDKDANWWSDQIEQINDIYVAFADMNLDLTKFDTKEYNLAFKDTSSEKFDKFIDEVFENELIEMMVNGGLRYAVKKLPEDLSEVGDTTDQVVKDKEVNKELKAFTSLVDIIRDDLEFKDGSVDLKSLNMKAMNDIVNTDILVNSKIVGKTVTVLLKNAISDIEYDGKTITFDKSMFDDANFSINNELKNLVEVLTLGFGEECSINTLQNLEDEAEVDNICKMLESNGLPNSKIANGLFSGLLPVVLEAITPSESYTDVTWANEYKSISGVLETMFSRSTKLKDLGNISFDDFTIAKVDELSKSTKIWAPNTKVVTKMLNGLVIPFIDDIQIDGDDITIDYNKNNIIWKNELASMVQLGLWANDTDNDPSNDYNNPISSITDAFGDTVKVRVLKSLGEEIQDSKQTELLHAFANAAMKKFLGNDILDAKYECPALANVANILDDNTSNGYLGYGTIEISTIGDKTEAPMPEAQFKKLTRSLSVEVVNSKYLRNTLAPKIAADVDKSTWSATKWGAEMTSVDVICQDIDGDASGNIELSKISDNMNTLKDSMLVNLQVETKTSLILQDIFGDALLNNNMINAKSDITNWDSEVDGLIPVVRTLEDSDNKVELNVLSNLNVIYTDTVDELEVSTHKSIVLMNTMAKNLAEPMSTPTMKNTDDTSAWSSTKWSNEMPHIGEVLKTLAKDDDSIVIDELEMDENSEIKKKTFMRIEEHIAFSEALENMFADALYDALYDSSNTTDVFPDAEAYTIKDDETYSSWWEAEIAGLLNIIYVKMATDNENETLKLSDFNDTNEVEVRVIKAFSYQAYTHTYDGDYDQDEAVMVSKVYPCGLEQATNIGVSEYLQYSFKPQFRDLSKRTIDGVVSYFVYEPDYNWDIEMGPIMDTFLVTQSTYDDVNRVLVEKNNDDVVEMSDEVFFGLYNKTQLPGLGKEAELRNKAILHAASENIDNISFLQFILSNEFEKIMTKEYMSSENRPNLWSNDTWIRETSVLCIIADELITEDNPKMEGLDFYKLPDDTVDLICEKTPQSYLLQSKMAKPFVDAGINGTDVTSVKSLIGTETTLMQYIIDYEWSDGENKAYKVLLETLNSKKESFKSMKNNLYGPKYESSILVGYEFYAEDNTTVLVNISINGEVTDGNGNQFLTEDVSTKINAVQTYTEYVLMIDALKKSETPEFVILAGKVAERANTKIYSE